MNHQSSYDKFPIKNMNGYENEAQKGWQAILETIKSKAQEILKAKNRCVIVVDCYPCTDTAELLDGLKNLEATAVFFSDDCAFTPEKLDEKLADNMTEDRVFGVMTTKTLDFCFDRNLISEATTRIQAVEKGIILVYGVGASLLAQPDILIYSDLARWEIQLRWRNGLSNWRCNNSNAPILSKYKRGFFAEWRFADKHKKTLFSKLDYLLDTNRPGDPVMVSKKGFDAALKRVSAEPFRTVPYFDPGVWGGQWMKDVCGLDRSKENFAWSFDGVPEENSLLFAFGDTVMEIPAMDLVLSHPAELLGQRVHARFGAEFPIRFDFLDTIGGENLSLQVHPLTEYIQENFNMRYTQDESYYILDAREDSSVYLGVKKGISPEKMMSALRTAERGEKPFPAEEFINKFPVKKHDHILIPAGTIHCSSSNTMVLEVSATPYIFTFKLWDWNRLGLDGLPRPTHLDHGEKNIQWNRDTDWVQEQLLHRERVLYEEEGCKIERTGLHEREFIDTFRYTLTAPCRILTGDSVNMLNLVDGESAVITSPNNSFEPYTVHYAETFIIPAAVDEYIISPEKPGAEIKVLLATVQNPSGSYAVKNI